MTNDLIKVYYELQENGELDDFIEEGVKDLFIDSYMEPSFQGWIYRIILDDDGLSVGGPMSNGSDLYSNYYGFTIEIAKMDAYNEFDSELIEEHIIEELSKNERRKLWNELLDDEDILILKHRYEDDDEKLTLKDILTEEYVIFEDIFKKVLRDKFDELKIEYIYCAWDFYFKDSIIEQIKFNIKELKEFDVDIVNL